MISSHLDNDFVTFGMAEVSKGLNTCMSANIMSSLCMQMAQHLSVLSLQQTQWWFSWSTQTFPQIALDIIVLEFRCSVWLWDHPSVFESNGHMRCYIEVIHLSVYISHHSLGYRTGRWITWLHVTTLWDPMCRCIDLKSHSPLTQIIVIPTWHILNVFPNWNHCPIIMYCSS